jgi:P27 family predicted phage terminase small subunit
MRGSKHVHDRKPSEEVSIYSGAPKPPTWLDKEARAEWHRIVPDLEAAGILCEVDRAALSLLCDAWSKYCDAREIVDREGLTVESPKGGTAKHPCVSVMTDMHDRWKRMCEQFGLTPQSRSRIRAPKPAEPQDGKGRFFKGGSA